MNDEYQHKRPLFVAIEGVDGAGTTTQSARLAETLNGQGHPSVVTREPGGTSIGEKIRALLLDPALSELSARAELLLYAASRAQHIDELIRPALKDGMPVISDRYTVSTLAYQGAGRGLDIDTIVRLNDMAVQECSPDVTVVLDVPLYVAFKRRNSIKKDRLELENEAFHSRVADAYRKIAADRPDLTMLVDATPTKEEVAAEIYDRLHVRWPEFPFHT